MNDEDLNLSTAEAFHLAEELSLTVPTVHLLHLLLLQNAELNAEYDRLEQSRDPALDDFIAKVLRNWRKMQSRPKAPMAKQTHQRLAHGASCSLKEPLAKAPPAAPAPAPPAWFGSMRYEDKCNACGREGANGSSSQLNLERFVSRCEWCGSAVCGSLQWKSYCSHFELGTRICNRCWPQYSTRCFSCAAPTDAECDVCDQLTCPACASVTKQRYTCWHCARIERSLESEWA